jgi:hypothetical protein
MVTGDGTPGTRGEYSENPLFPKCSCSIPFGRSAWTNILVASVRDLSHPSQCMVVLEASKSAFRSLAAAYSRSHPPTCLASRTWLGISAPESLLIRKFSLAAKIHEIVSYPSSIHVQFSQMTDGKSQHVSTLILLTMG